MKQLNFRRASSEDANFVFRLRSKNDVRLQLQDPTIFNIKECATWLDNQPSTSERILVIFNKTKVGLIRIDKKDYNNGHCAVGFDIIEKYRKTGINMFIFKWIHDEFLLNRNFNLIWGDILETNKGAIKQAKKIGMNQDGIIRQFYYRNGKYLDIVRVSQTRNEWMVNKEALSEFFEFIERQLNQ